MAKNASVGVPEIGPETWLQIVLAEHLRRRDHMIALRASSGTPHGKAEYERELQLYAIEERIAIGEAPSRQKPEGAKCLLVTLACKLRDGDALSHDARMYLSEALVAIAARPDSAAQRLGLVGPHGKTPSRSVEARNVGLAFAVHALRENFPLASGVDAAIAQVSEKAKVGESTVRDAYEKYRHYAEFSESCAAQQFEQPDSGEEHNTD